MPINLAGSSGPKARNYTWLLAVAGHSENMPSLNYTHLQFIYNDEKERLRLPDPSALAQRDCFNLELESCSFDEAPNFVVRRRGVAARAKQPRILVEVEQQISNRLRAAAGTKPVLHQAREALLGDAWQP